MQTGGRWVAVLTVLVVLAGCGGSATGTSVASSSPDRLRLSAAFSSSAWHCPQSVAKVSAVIGVPMTLLPPTPTLGGAYCAFRSTESIKEAQLSTPPQSRDTRQLGANVVFARDSSDTLQANRKLDTTNTSCPLSDYPTLGSGAFVQRCHDFRSSVGVDFLEPGGKNTWRVSIADERQGAAARSEGVIESMLRIFLTS
jgi:hypothetical protein